MASPYRVYKAAAGLAKKTAPIRSGLGQSDIYSDQAVTVPSVQTIWVTVG